MQAPHLIAADVIDIEANGLAALSDALRAGDSALCGAFAAAAAICVDLKGRLIVTGMGKSGHVARKIAATFASTGTPSMFVHPAEASHGDLGMITQNDVVLALSLSGETAELRDIIAYTGRFDIPLIALTGGEQSSLARASDIVIPLPSAREACALTQAPTTSTTMMLALGDALAISVLRQKGITARDFGDFHPGGKLGAALKRASDLMHHTDLPLCGLTAGVPEIIQSITRSGFGCVGVVDDLGRLAGIITDGDLRRHFQNPGEAAAAQTLMTKSPHVATADSLAGEVLALFAEKKITAVFLVDEGQVPIGLIHVHDCLTTGVI